jgi:hypothetical protein
MDLWDVTKLLARRWFIAVPLLLVTFGIALWIGLTTDPDYKATSHVTLLPPTVRRDPQAGTAQNVNPWTVETLTAAVLTRLNSKAQHDALEAEGLSPIWETDTDLRFHELISIEVTAHDEETARATTRRLQAIATEEVTRQQDRYNLKQGEEITTIPFDTGENVEPSRSKVLRAMVVVVGVGGILTVATVIALDALLRLRSRRRTASGRARPGQLLVGQRTDKPTAPATRVVEPTPAPSPPISVPIAVRTMSQPTSSKGKPPANGMNGNGDETTVIATPGTVRNGVTRPVDQSTKPAEPPKVDRPVVEEDATIVLPLSNAPWRNDPRKSTGKSSDSGNKR